MKWRTSLKVLLALLLFGCGLEGGLRLQQWLGPFVDLDFAFVSSRAEGSSDLLNHSPAPTHEALLSDPEVYGDHAGLRYTNRYDSDGLRLNSRRSPPVPDTDALTTILFLGDSFVQGYDDLHTLPQQVWQRLKAERPQSNLNVLNGGLTSYSPAIQIPQAKLLCPRYEPDIVVVVIDETDLGDDSIRYERLIRRNEAGEVIAVRPTPLSEAFLEGFQQSGQHWLYLFRMAHKLYHTWIFMPIFEAGYRSWDPREPLELVADVRPDAASRLATEIWVFRRNLRELGRALLGFVGSPDRLLWVRHPHLGHLRDPADPQRWNSLVGDSVQAVSGELGIPYYNVEAEMREAFGRHPDLYYWNGDMHFNFKGIEVYGRLLASRLSGVVARLEEDDRNPAGNRN